MLWVASRVWLTSAIGPVSHVPSRACKLSVNYIKVDRRDSCLSLILLSEKSVCCPVKEVFLIYKASLVLFCVVVLTFKYAQIFWDEFLSLLYE